MAKAFAEIEAASDAANLGHPNGGLYASIARCYRRRVSA
jgi:hypothetical protein